MIIPEVIKKIAATNSTHPYYSIYTNPRAKDAVKKAKMMLYLSFMSE